MMLIIKTAFKAIRYEGVFRSINTIDKIIKETDSILPVSKTYHCTSCVNGDPSVISTSVKNQCPLLGVELFQNR